MPEKILIVQQDRRFALLLAEQLQYGGYETETAVDGFEAIHKTAQYRPDLVLLDVMLPRLDGWESLRRIREFTSVPVIMVSSCASELDKVRSFDFGADDYVVKPVPYAEFMARVKAALRRKNHPIATRAIIHVDDRLVVDHVRQEAYVDGEPARLSGIQYKLLSCLLNNAGYICSRRLLLTQVWGWEYADEGAYVKVHIHHLRRKIEKDPAKPQYIITEPGKGYSFVDDWRRKESGFYESHT